MFFKLWCCQLVCGWLWRSGATILLKVGSSFSACWGRNDIKLKIFRFVFVIMITFAGLVVVSTFRSWSSFDSTANQLKPNQPWIPVWKSEWMRLGLRSQIGVRVAIHIMVSDFFTALALYNWQALVWWVNINFFFPQPLFSFLHCFWLCCLRMKCVFYNLTHHSSGYLAQNMGEVQTGNYIGSRGTSLTRAVLLCYGNSKTVCFL